MLPAVQTIARKPAKDGRGKVGAGRAINRRFTGGEPDGAGCGGARRAGVIWRGVRLKPSLVWSYRRFCIAARFAAADLWQRRVIYQRCNPNEHRLGTTA